MFHEFKTIIIGAGFSGLALALSLMQKGYKVELYEKRENLLEVGAGVQIAPNGARVIKQLGLFEQVSKHACQSRYRKAGLWDSDQTHVFHDLDQQWLNCYGNYWSMSRNDLYQNLLEAVLALDSSCIHTGYKFINFDQSGNHVIAHFENGKTATGNLIIGADGLFSQVRRVAFNDLNPQYAEMIAWRGMGNMVDLPEYAKSTDTEIFHSSNQLVITYPLHANKYFYFFGITKRSEFDQSKLFEYGTNKDCLDDFNGWNQTLTTRIKHFNKVWKWPLYFQPPAEKWFDSNLALIGDACHAVMPFNGQGLTMGLEDAMALSCYLDHFELPSNALALYGINRKERACKIFNNSSWMYKKFLEGSYDAEKKIQDIANSRDQMIQQHFDWIWSYDATNINV
jgi:salicylate hydroxylase